MKGTFHKSTVALTVLITILAVYFLGVCIINFSAVPSFFDSDMYCDYRYAMEVWEYKSIFPEGWVFGNQLNVVSTPVLAALLYGMTGSINFSMATACTLMAVLVMLCFDWMIRPVIQKVESRLLASALFMTAVLYCGSAVRGNQGWTLLFTMCSYYAGYSITAFLAFGCYLRSLSGRYNNWIVLTTLTCLLSFGTGMQSIRQTAIMVAPILAVEFLRLIVSYRKWKENRMPLWTAMGITISNVLGVVYVKMLEINQNQIFGKIELTRLSELKQAASGCFSLMKDLLGADHPEAFWILAILCVLCVASFQTVLKNTVKEKNFNAAVLILLILASVAVIMVIDIFTTMYVRPRYYFMLYPLMGVMIAYLYDNGGSWIKWGLMVFLSVFFCAACTGELLGPCSAAVSCRQQESYAISEYLLEEGYTTVYAEWNLGHEVAVASNGRINTGYWYTEEQPYEKVTHLCSLDIYAVEPEKCVYLFEGEDDAQIGIAAAEALGAQLQFLRHFPERDTYLYTAAANLMQLFGRG